MLGLGAICLAGLPIARAQSGTILLSELPPPPVAIAELLKQADIRFCYGWQEKPSSMTMPSGRRLDALTVYKMKYDFRTQNRLQRRGSRQQMVTTIRLGRTGLTCGHVVWFRDLPNRETFWTNWLVLHELDHVRISSDPRHEKQFRKRLSENAVLVQQSGGSVSTFNGQSQQSAKGRVEAVFREITTLVDIRYKELDRLTDHGLRALPKDTTLDAILNGSP
ncbi:hypothetical protein Poly59_21660 [Rubripirellula reticaptiva]|uniref:Uncharacterized protein n=2 Tax=Rubripirellula reticaptiva TaxID=2528013 RepID=A0A5C6F230_9BACT|nr:hypothetical protein Poly59_21660 [Rubripirellula reticaptiva]